MDTKLLKTMFVCTMYIMVILAIVFLVTGSASALLLCSDPLGCVTIGPNDPVHIAYALVISEPDSSLGIDARNGIEIAIDDSGGKILGHDILLTGEDETCSAEGGLAAGTLLAADPTIVAVIGTSCSAAARMAMPLLSAAGFVMVSPSNTGPDLTEPGNPNNHPGYLRTSWNDKVQGAIAARFAREHLGISTAATINDGSLYSIYLQQSFADEFTNLGGTITTQATIDPSQIDMSTELINIAAGAPEMLYFPIFMPAGGLLINQARTTAGLESAYLMGSDGLWTEDIVIATGENVEGFMVTGWDSTKNSPEYVDHFLPAYQAIFGTEPISMFHAHAYDAFMLIKAAIEKVAVVDLDGTIQIGRQALRDALYGTVNFAGLTGILTCSATGDCADPHIAVYKYHTGQFPPQYFWPHYPPPFWRDEFDGPLAEGWYWVNENLDKWNFSDGFLRIDASPYATGGENLLLRPVAPGDFMIKTRLLFEPDTNFQFAGLVIWQDGNNFLQLGRAFCDVPDACVGNGIYFDKIQDGNFTDSNFARTVDNPAEAFLRLERRGDMVKAFYSYEGITWFEIGTHWIPSDFQVNGVGLTASQDYNTPDRDIPAEFDFFELAEGWGFLPEGFHDFDQGDVPSWACNAGGWAADPDDRAARLNLEIVVDHQTVATLVAEEFRQDLLDAEVCEGGNCSFSTSLWGAISSYEPHSVIVYAQDIFSGEWVQLSNSPKPLTCRTYDIYAFDPLTGETKQITDLRETDEYNPSWSPNGKKVAHDVVSGDSHGIYITDVKTGVSIPLVGAQDGGNDAVWSPNGKWIVFDRYPVGDPSLYLVPSTGGSRTLVRSNAISADWAPNGKRLVFQQPRDGSIRTIPMDGGRGGETLIAARGANPAWSLDGNWIAYEQDGDIWKVQVNVQGTVFGDPIQVTSLAAGEGQPTWSADSQTIVFHSGLSRDYDLWTVPAAGGDPTWLTGAPGFGDFDPAYAKNSSNIAYASFSPTGQAARLWVAAFTHDLPAGTLTDGTYPYHFEFEWSVPEPGSWSGQGGEFVISSEVEVYGGYVLLRGPMELRGVDSPEGLVCEEVGEINPGQPTRFLIGWLPDYGEITYPEARAHFESITARAIWDDGMSEELTRHEIIPFRWDDWFQYVCTFTEAPPKMDLRVNYGHDWVESFYEAGHEVVITVTDSGGVEKATATVLTEPKDFWGGETGFQTVPEDWSPGPPDLQPYDWVYAQVDNGATAQVQLGDIRGEVRFDLDSVTGTIEAWWITDPVRVECLDWGSGGEPINKEGGYVLTNGAEYYYCSWNLETEWDVQPWQDIGVGYFTPDGHWVANAFRDERWMAMWTYDLGSGFWMEGEHSYYFQWSYTVPEPDDRTMDPLTMTVASSTEEAGKTPIYVTYVLIQPWGWMPQQAWTDSACEPISVVHPNQPTRFVWGWVNDFSMTYEEALDHFTSFTVETYWDGDSGGSVPLTMGELLPFTGREARWEYLCTLTEHP